jgi:hypothetical protein
MSVDQKSNWRPISTAPMDGSDVLVFGNGRYAVAYWNGEEWRDVGDIGWAGMYGDDNQPTHWMPLVAPCVVIDSKEPDVDVASAVREAFEPFRIALWKNETDTIGSLSKDDELLFVLGGSWTGSSKVTLGDLRRLSKAIADNGKKCSGCESSN